MKPKNALKEYVRVQLEKNGQELNLENVKVVMQEFFDRRHPKAIWVKTLREFMIRRGVSSAVKMPETEYMNLVNEIEYDRGIENLASSK